MANIAGIAIHPDFPHHPLVLQTQQNSGVGSRFQQNLPVEKRLPTVTPDSY